MPCQTRISAAARLALLAGAFVMLISASPLKAAPAVDPEGDRAFRASCKYLAEAKAFSVKVEVWRDAELANGARIQTTRTLDVQAQRPDKLRVEVRSPRESKGFWYLKNSLTMLDRETRFYGVMETPETIDKTIDAVEERFGVEIPLGDVLVSDPYMNIMENIESLTDLGQVTVLGTPCRHLSFTGPNADAQVWIAEGPKPLPRKITIHFKAMEGSPQVTQIFTDWDLVGPFSDSVFTFVPPPGAIKIAVSPRKPQPEPAAPTTAPADK